MSSAGTAKKTLRHCLDSLIAQDYPNLEIVVVDNDSSDGSETFVRNVFPEVHCLQTGANLFYGGGNNYGIRHAVNELAAEFVALINPDAAAAPDWISESMRLFDDPQVANVGPKVLFWDKFIEIRFNEQFTAGSIQSSDTSYHKIVEVYPGWKRKWENTPNGGWTIPANVPAKVAIGAGSRELRVEIENWKLEAGYSKLENRNSGFKVPKLIIGTGEYTGKMMGNEITYKLPKNAYEQASNVINSLGTEFDGYGSPQDIGYGEFEAENRSLSHETRGGKPETGNGIERDGINGVAMVLRVETLKEVGIFDTTYNMYIEESELCLRIKQAGYKQIHFSEVTVRHKHMQSTNQTSRHRYLYWTSRNRILLAWDHYPKRKTLRMLQRTWNNLGIRSLRVYFSFIGAVVGRIIKPADTML